MSEHIYIAMKHGKSSLFPHFRLGKTVIIGVVGNMFPRNAVPEGFTIAMVDEWDTIRKDTIEQMEEENIDTIIFYSYDKYSEVKGHIKRIEALLEEHFRGQRRSIFMFKGL